MRQIAEGFFRESPFMAGPLIAMLLFVAVFAVVVVRVLAARKNDIDRSARMPLEEGEDHE
jgi:hypothetical protein